MFARSLLLNYILSALFVLSMGACSGSTGCGCGSSSPLPAGGLPGDQTIEGGAQIRVTPEGFTKLATLIPGIINQALSSGGICIPGNTFGATISGFPLATASYCEENNGPSCTNGCLVDVGLNTSGTSTTVVGNQLQVNISTSLNTSIDLKFVVADIQVASCTLGIASSNLNGSFDIGFGIQSPNGELELTTSVNSFQLNLNFTGCSILSDIANDFSSLLDSIPAALQSLLSPIVNKLVQGL